MNECYQMGHTIVGIGPAISAGGKTHHDVTGPSLIMEDLVMCYIATCLEQSAAGWLHVCVCVCV
jgi:hypothetical protein